MSLATNKVAIKEVIPPVYAQLFPYEHFNKMQSSIAQVCIHQHYSICFLAFTLHI
jgi:hypothetical protein